MIFYLILDEKRSPEVVEPYNTHEKDDTDKSATSHVNNSNKELELTCDTTTSPRIIIHNSDGNHENNNHIGCTVNHVTTKINSNQKFTDRIEQLSTVVGQLEKLLDGNSSEFSAVDGHSDNSLDDNDQTTIQCDNFIQSDHAKSKVDHQADNHVTNSCHHETENCAGRESSCDTLDTVFDSGEQRSNVNQVKK